MTKISILKVFFGFLKLKFDIYLLNFGAFFMQADFMDRH